MPVEPGAIEEYVLRLYPFASTFRPGHRLVVELSNDEPLADEHNALLPPDAFHLPVGRPVTHKIYRDAAAPLPARAAVHAGGSGGVGGYQAASSSAATLGTSRARGLG